MGTGAAKITNKEYPRAGTQIFFKKIACAETAEPRMTVPYTTHVTRFEGGSVEHVDKIDTLKTIHKKKAFQSNVNSPIFRRVSVW